MTYRGGIHTQCPLVFGLLCLTRITLAQSTGIGFADGGPRFVRERADHTIAIADAKHDAALQRPVTINVDHAVLGDVLAQIASQTHTQFAIGNAADVVKRRVSLHVDRISLAGALFEILNETNIDVVIKPGGMLALIPSGALSEPSLVVQVGGGIVGRVRDASSGEPLAGATIRLVGSTHMARSEFDGRYTIRDVEPREYAVIARRLGYSEWQKMVVVHSVGVDTVDIELSQSPHLLDQVVSTPTGDEARRELGNDIATIAADSAVRNEPVMTLSDVLTARASGVQVYVPGGVSGASPAIVIRGQNSISLSDQPLLVVDGVRIDNSTASGAPSSSSGTIDTDGSSSGRFNDILPSEIETIQVVKGPSAATLYGTEAANGVIVITTKQGRSGPTRWNGYSETGGEWIPKNEFPENYTSFGTLTGTDSVTTCPLLAIGGGICRQDSVTRFTPLRNSQLTPIGTGARGAYGMQASGGTDHVRYFVSGSYEAETGVLRLPPADVAIANVERGSLGLTYDEIHPNGYRKYGGRSNTTMALNTGLDLSVSAAYLDNKSRLPGDQEALLGGEVGPGYRGTTDGWVFGVRPANTILKDDEEDASHLTAGGTLHWHRLSWLDGHATLGLDNSSTALDFLIRPGENINLPTGQRTSGKTNAFQYSFDAGATATASPVSWFSARTSTGVQYNRAVSDQTLAFATNLTPGGQSVQQGIQQSSEYYIESIVAGVYAQEELAIRDRLFLTIADRLDGTSVYGVNYHPVWYPKASASWLVSREPFWPSLPFVSSVRLRGAYGQSGYQPPGNPSLITVSTGTAYVGGATVVGGSINEGAGPQLKPERQAEMEGGFDVSLFRERVQVEGTYYQKHGTDEIVDVNLPTDVSTGSALVNVGSVRNIGLEGLLSVSVISGHAFSWDVSLSASVNHNRVLALQSAAAAAAGIGKGTGFGFNAGYPLNSYFEYKYRYADLNHDGIIESNEVSIDSTPSYLGSSSPSDQYVLQSAFSLAKRVHLRVQFDRRAGFVLDNLTEATRCQFGNCRADNVRSASLADQAAAVASASTPTGYIQGGAFTRLREVAINFGFPEHWTSLLHLRSPSLTVGIRNLAIWTSYKGIDPEVTALKSIPQGVAYLDNSSIPVARYWIFRFNTEF